MVHALRAAHRLLKANGIVLDVRPGAKHRRVGTARAGRWCALGTMREELDDDRAANAAVADVVRQGLFRRERQMHLDLRRYMDTVEDFRAWLDEFPRLADRASQKWLVKRVEHALRDNAGTTKIVVRGPLELRVLRKRSPVAPTTP